MVIKLFLQYIPLASFISWLSRISCSHGLSNRGLPEEAQPTFHKPVDEMNHTEEVSRILMSQAAFTINQAVC